MVRTGRISGRRPNPPILFSDQIFVSQLLQPAVSPLLPDSFVEVFGERLGQTVCQRLGHDRIVIVVILIEPTAKLVQSQPCRDGKSPDMVRSSRRLRRNVIGQRQIGLALWFSSLLPQRMNGR